MYIDDGKSIDSARSSVMLTKLIDDALDMIHVGLACSSSSYTNFMNAAMTMAIRPRTDDQNETNCHMVIRVHSTIS
jgi:hypothetical protein